MPRDIAAVRAWRRITAEIAAAPIPQRVRDNPRTHRNIWPFRAAPYVSPSRALITAELARRPTVNRYRVRETEVVIHLRHPHRDLWMLDEIFHRSVYEPPPAVRRTLADLGRPPRVLDLGSHVGLAAAYFAGEFPGSSVVSFEPDPGNLDLLRRTIAANASRIRWDLVAAAAAPRDGTARFVSDGHLSHVLSGPEPTPSAIEVPTRDVFPFLEDADLVKIDVQGSEWDLLMDPRFEAAGPRVLVLEYHPYGHPATRRVPPRRRCSPLPATSAASR